MTPTLQSVTVFDSGKARQTIYSILMGFVLKGFIEHVYILWPGILSLDAIVGASYLLLLVYFFVNCFRFLFGLVDLSRMTDSEFAPGQDEWHLKKVITNLLKLIVVNTGVFQLVIFSFLAFSIFPPMNNITSYSSPDLSELIRSAFPAIVCTFFIWNFMLMLSDIICVGLYLFLEKSENVDINEKMQSAFWIGGGIIELLLSVIGFLAIWNLASANYATLCVVLICLLTLNVFEMIGGYKYIGYHVSLIRSRTADSRS